MNDHNDQVSRRRGMVGVGLGLAAAATMPFAAAIAAPAKPTASTSTGKGTQTSSTFKTKDGTDLYYKDWGTGQPIVFHHGWPLTADEWDSQMLYFIGQGYRVVAFDRRGDGRSSQNSTGIDMDTFSSDTADLVAHLNLTNTIQVGHSTGGGVVARYVAQHGGGGKVAKAVLIGAVTPIMLKTDKNPGGLPMSVFDGFRKALATNRPQFYADVASGPFYGFNRSGAKVSEALARNWWRQGMLGGAKAQYDCIKAFSESDFTEDLKKIDVPVLVMHGEDDQIVPIADSAQLAIKLLKHGTLKTYPGYPHGMATVNADVINPDLLAFLKS